MGRKIKIFDSTLRDGAQGEGIAFSLEDKLNIVKTLDELGIDYIEAGNPYSNPKDLEFFERVSRMELKHATLVAFGSTRRKNTPVEEDGNCAALLRAGAPAVAIFGKSWDLHVTDVIRTTLEENLAMIADTCRFFKARGKQVIFDAEHFFDGYKRNPDYALRSLEAAADAGADVLALCDTNGGSFPDEIAEIVRVVAARFPGVDIGIHAHNDGGMAVANSVMAVEAGVSHVQGTFLGFGERTGNANLSTILANLQLKRGCDCIPAENMSTLTDCAIRMAEIANVTLHKGTPFVGRSAFAHKAGMHADGVIKNSGSFEHVDPASVGNHRRFLMSEMAGKSAVVRKLQKYYPEITRDDPAVADIIAELKEKERRGYQYEGADGSFELIARRHIDGIKPYFDLVSYKVLDELPYDNNHSATATIKIKSNDVLKVAAAEGDGPVNALDCALREALAEFYPQIAKAKLIDYKVRVMEPDDATAAVVRVLIITSDGKDVWTTVGVSKDIIEASWIALVDSVVLYLTTH